MSLREEFGDETEELAQQSVNYSDDDGNIDDGEYWGEVEDKYIDKCISHFLSMQINR